MKLFCTGTSGSGRHDYVSKFIAYSKDQGIDDIAFFDVGKMIFEVAAKQGLSITEEKILDTPRQTLDALRAAAFEKIKSESTDQENYVILSHACFRWKKCLIPSFDIYYLNELKPDIYVTIIDDISIVKAKLDVNNQWTGQISMKELLMWREEEIFVTKLMADYQKKGFYILARQFRPEVLFKLAFRPNIKKIYLSYPITHIKGDTILMKKKDEIYENLNKNFIVFDPLAIKDMDLVYAIEGKGQDEVVNFPVQGNAHTFSCKEIGDAAGDIEAQVVSRDYKLIDQSSMVVVYYPTNLMSPGVSSEMTYAFNNNKPVYAVFPFRQSPFFKSYCERTFMTEGECLNYLESQGTKEI